jgi:2-keto-4-pentenoate hydratase
MSTPLSNAQIAQAAEAVADAYRNNTVMDDLPPGCMPETVADARAIQDRLAGLLGPAIGWKVGHGNPAMRKRLGEGVPSIGRLFEGMVVESPATISRSILENPFVEGELAVRLGSDLPPRDGDYSVDEVLDAIDAVMPAIEFAEVRNRNFTDMSVLGLIVFNAGAFRLILGPEIADWRRAPIMELTAQLVLDGDTVTTEFTDEQRTDYAWVMHFLANDLSRRGIGLMAGQIVSTGVILKYFPLGATSEAVFNVDGVGEARLKIEP